MEQPGLKPVFVQRSDGQGLDVLLGERNIGRLDSTRKVYTSYRDEFLHRARVLDAYGIEISLMEMFWAGDPPVEFIDLDITKIGGERRTYRTTLAAWKAWGQVHTLSLDFGPQLFLTVHAIEGQSMSRNPTRQKKLGDGKDG